MVLFTLGFTQKSAEKFFSIIRSSGIDMLADIRLNNVSQLAGFTKGKDLEFFLKEICNCKYSHEIECAPTKEILDGYKSGKITWDSYDDKYRELINKRNALKHFYNAFSKYQHVCLLCSEPTPENCHRRLFAEMLQQNYPEIQVKHL